MNVLLISQCRKRALTETRRILDQFAERRGERVWQTAITLQGLEAVHRLLRRTARRNTAVACHWIRGLNHSELLWVVGDASQFNAQGAVPTNETQRDVLRSDDENDWHSGELIRLLAALAALFHDFGKACDTFQGKLAGASKLADVFRHEWVSLRLFEAFVRSCGLDDDRGWLQALADPTPAERSEWLGKIVRDNPQRPGPAPLRALPPLAQIIGWLIVSHHRLPTQPRGRSALPAVALQGITAEIRADWCGMRLPDPDADARGRAAHAANADGCWAFSKGLADSPSWRRHASRLALALLARLPREDLPARLQDDYVLHLARLALMLADHHYSAGPSLPRYGDAGGSLFANTDRQSGRLKQRLDEHLIGVAVGAGRIVRALPRLAQQLPRIARHRGLRKRSADRRFAWQDRAFELAESLRERSAEQGFFGINLASTGCGKTRANARILYALADPQRGARFTVALGLRTLTLQTGEVYRSEYGLGDADLAVLVGSAALRELHEQQACQTAAAGTPETALERLGSESAEALLAGAHVHFSGSLEDGPLNHWLGDSPDARRLLAAPVLACTIDHLMPATEGTRGGRQIAPMLRLLTADLILDEPDDFGTEDLSALCRLVHWAGLLGARVLLSSATLPPALVQALFDAYRSGRAHFRRNRGRDTRPLPVCCAWFDEFGCTSDEPADLVAFAGAHAQCVERRLQRLAGAPSRRAARIVPLVKTPGLAREAVFTQLAQTLREQAPALHALHHALDPHSAGRVSFGLIRMAHIDELFGVAQALIAAGGDGWHLHLCVYHSRYPLLQRSRIEATLDRLLKRHPDPATDRRRFDDPELRGWIDAAPAPDHLFIVLATAVAEVGRDHDYDWAIVEPSSMRSIIQLAGRVRRHRPGPCAEPNIALLETNLGHLLKAPGEAAFTRPGFEDKPGFLLRSHSLFDLLSPAQLNRLDAAPRLCEPEPLQPQDRLADLEHARLRELLLAVPLVGQRQQQIPARLWWTTRAPLSGECQRYAPFRDDQLGRQRFVVQCTEDDGLSFRRVELDGATVDTDARHLFEPVTTPLGPHVSYWGAPDYRSVLEALAAALQLETTECARRYGTLDLPLRSAEQGWRYDAVLGCARRR